MTIPTDLITPKAAARLVACSPHTIRRWMRTGRIKGYLRGRSRFLVSRAEVMAQIEEVVALPEVQSQAAVNREHEEAMVELRRRGLKV